MKSFAHNVALLLISLSLFISATYVEAIPWVNEIVPLVAGENTPAVSIVDNFRNRVYIVGTTTSQLAADVPPVTTGSDIYILGYDQSSGELLFRRTYSSIGGTDVAIDALFRSDNFNFVIVGRTDGVWQGNTKVGNQDGFVLCLDVTLDISWVYQFGIPNGETYPIGIKKEPTGPQRMIVVANARDNRFNTPANNTLIYLSARSNGRIRFQVTETIVTSPVSYFAANSFGVTLDRYLIGYEVYSNMTDTNFQCTGQNDQYLLFSPQQERFRLVDRRGSTIVDKLAPVDVNPSVVEEANLGYCEAHEIQYSASNNQFLTICSIPAVLNPFIGTDGINYITCNSRQQGLFVYWDINTLEQKSFTYFVGGIRGAVIGPYKIQIKANEASGVPFASYNTNIGSSRNLRVGRTTNSHTTYDQTFTLGPVTPFRNSDGSIFFPGNIYLTHDGIVDTCNEIGIENPLAWVNSSVPLSGSPLVVDKGFFVTGICPTLLNGATSNSASSYFLAGFTEGSLVGFPNDQFDKHSFLVKIENKVYPKLNPYCDIPGCDPVPTPSPGPTLPPKPCQNASFCNCMMTTFSKCLTPIPGREGKCDTSECTGLICDPLCESPVVCRLEDDVALIQTTDSNDTVVDCAVSKTVLFPVPLWAPIL